MTKPIDNLSLEERINVLERLSKISPNRGEIKEKLKELRSIKKYLNRVSKQNEAFFDKLLSGKNKVGKISKLRELSEAMPNNTMIKEKLENLEGEKTFASLMSKKQN